MRGLGFDGLCGEGSEGREGQRGTLLGGSNDCLQSADGLRLPGVRLGLIGLAEADAAVVGQISRMAVRRKALRAPSVG